MTPWANRRLCSSSSPWVNFILFLLSTFLVPMALLFIVRALVVVARCRLVLGSRALLAATILAATTAYATMVLAAMTSPPLTRMISHNQYLYGVLLPK
jgi:hypothetical protein